MKKFLPPVAVAAALVISMPALQQVAHAQGCVAAHSPQPIISGLDPGAESNARHYAGSGLLRGLALSMGGRMEGVPVRDAFGKSNGFRRPGYVISIEPGLMYARGSYMVNVSGPWAMERNRKTSVTDFANHSHGDAAFADYTIIAGISKTF